MVECNDDCLNCVLPTCKYDTKTKRGPKTYKNGEKRKKQTTEEHKAYMRQYYHDNIEERKEYMKEYYQKNKERIKERSKQYFKEHRKEIYAYQRKRYKILKERYKDETGCKIC